MTDTFSPRSGSDTYCKARQEPTEAAKDEGLNEANDVEQLPALDTDAIESKEDGDGAVDCHTQGEGEKPAPVSKSHTVVDVRTVMIKLSILN